MRNLPANKYRAAMEVLQRGRDLLVDSLAEEVLDQQEDLLEGGFQFHEFLETQGARLHFLGLIMAHLEQSAEFFDEVNSPPPRPQAPPPRPAGPRARRRSRGRGVPYSNSRPGGESPPDSKEPIDEPPF
jgi:hypothetical protein